MENYRILMAQRRLLRGRLLDKQATKASPDAVITHVTQATVEDTAEVPVSEDTRTLKEIWEQECDCGIPYKTFKQRVERYGWTVERALHEGKK